MSRNDSRGRQYAFRLMLRPIVRFFLRGSHTVQEAVEELKRVVVEVAEEEIERSGHTVNPSRISMMTGLHRKEVNRIKAGDEGEEREPINLIGRILAQWEHDERFRGSSGKPKLLTYKGDDNQFKQLVHSVSRNLTPGTVLAEMERLQLVEKTGRGLRLLGVEHLLLSGEEEAKYRLVAQEVGDMVRGADENILRASDDPDPDYVLNLHLRTEFDNVFKSDIPQIRAWLLDEGKEFHRKAREFLSQFDKDVVRGRDKEEAGARVVLGAFSVTKEPEEE